MKKILIALLLIFAMLSAVACGETEVSNGSGIGDGSAVGDVGSDVGSNVGSDESLPSDENKEGSQPEDGEDSEDPTESSSAEDSAETDPSEGVASEDPAETAPEDSAPEEGASEDVYADRIDFTKVSSFGLPEPPFEYTYYYYEETFGSRDANGEPILSPKFVYDFDCDLETMYNYMKTVQSSGWGDYVPEKVPTLLPGDSFWYSSEKDGISVYICWDTEGDHYYWVTDKTRTCSWDSDLSVYVIDDFGEFGTYGHYMMPVQN